MDKIVIIGANESINPLILKAKVLGYETHVFSWQTGAIGEKTADIFYPISVDNKEEILKACKEIGPIGVVSITSDFAVQTVNYVARALGFNCNSEKADLVSRNKYQMRLAFKEANIPTPWFTRVDGSNSIDKASKFEYPLIVKPTDRWSSKGVSRVNSSEELLVAIKNAINESFGDKAIIEGYMEGPEYSCECISYNGKHHLLAFTKKHTTGYPHYIETGHMQPSDIAKDIQIIVIEVIFKALDALNIKYGASHTEFKLLENGQVGIIEVGARMGGDCIGTDLVQISAGYDYVKMVIDVATGKEPIIKKTGKTRIAMIKYILEENDLEKLKFVQENYAHYIWRVSEIDEIGSRDVVDSSTRFGYFILSIETSDVIAQNNLLSLL